MYVYTYNCHALNGNRYTDVKLVKGAVTIGCGWILWWRGEEEKFDTGGREDVETEKDGYILGEDPNCIFRDMNGRLTSNLCLWQRAVGRRKITSGAHRCPAGIPAKTEPLRFQNVHKPSHHHHCHRQRFVEGIVHTRAWLYIV